MICSYLEGVSINMVDWPGSGSEDRGVIEAALEGLPDLPYESGEEAGVL